MILKERKVCKFLTHLTPRSQDTNSVLSEKMMARNLEVVHRTSAGIAHTCGDSAPMVGSASGGFVRQVPPLPVTPAVGRFLA